MYNKGREREKTRKWKRKKGDARARYTEKEGSGGQKTDETDEIKQRAKGQTSKEGEGGEGVRERTGRRRGCWTQVFSLGKEVKVEPDNMEMSSEHLWSLEVSLC